MVNSQFNTWMMPIAPWSTCTKLTLTTSRHNGLRVSYLQCYVFPCPLLVAQLLLAPPTAAAGYISPEWRRLLVWKRETFVL